MLGRRTQLCQTVRLLVVPGSLIAQRGQCPLEGKPAGDVVNDTLLWPTFVHMTQVPRWQPGKIG